MTPIELDLGRWGSARTLGIMGEGVCGEDKCGEELHYGPAGVTTG